MFFVSIIVKATGNDRSEDVIRKFQKRITLENVVLEYRERQFHKSNSEKRQEMRKEKLRKIRRAKRLSREY